MASQKKSPLTRTARASILVAREQGQTYKQITEALDTSAGGIRSVLKWAEKNPELAKGEIAQVFGDDAGEDPSIVVPKELLHYWLDSTRRVLDETMILLTRVREGATSEETEVRTDYDAEGKECGRRETTRTKRGAGEDLYKVAGLLKILADASPKMRSLLVLGATEEQEARAPTVAVNVTQQVHTGDNILVAEVEEAEDHVIALDPEERRDLFDLLGDDDLFEDHEPDGQ